MSFKSTLISIDPSKNCLKFLADRILDNGYRGIQISQHNRYDINVVIILLEEFYNLVGRGKMAIRNTDLSKRPMNTPDEYIYAIYTNNVNNILGRCTQDSLRKNLFVDFHRMGLINRFDEKLNKIGPYDKKSIKYVSLTDIGMELIQAKNDKFQAKYIYTKAIDTLTHGFAEELIDILRYNSQDNISIYEFMFFISYLGKELNGHYYTKTELIDYMNEFRTLSKYQQQAVIDLVSNYCNPINFKGDKTKKRDYGNWKNEAQQIFMLMDQTVLFERGSKELSNNLYIRIGKESLFNDDSKLTRSKKAKDDYFVNHNVSKKLGFELHHIIPLLTAKNRNEFDLLDVWENMLYIDGYTHSLISQMNNKNIKILFEKDDIILKDIAGIKKDVVCVCNENVIYSLLKKEVIKEYNINIINKM